MSEQRERMEKTLRGCAEMGVPDTVDLWPAIRERVTAKPRRSRRIRLVPRTRVGWAFMALLVMLFGTGAYAAPMVYDAFQEALPGSTGRDVGTEIG